MSRKWFKLGSSETAALPVGPLSLQVKASLKLHSSKRWILLNQVSQVDENIVMSNGDNLSVVLEQNTGAIQVNAKGRVIEQVRLLFCGDNLRSCFTQGYQTWNLSNGGKLSQGRVKSLASKFGLSGMFQDTDNPVWSMKGTGRESHGTVVLEHSDGKFSILAGTSCTKGVTSFWAYEARGTSNIKCVLDFGVPGVQDYAEEKFLVAQADSAQELLEMFAAECKNNMDSNGEDPLLQMESPLRNLDRAPVGWGSWYEFYEKVTSKDIENVLSALKKDEDLKRSIDVFQLDDGYQLNTGDWLDTLPRFGNDISSVAQHIKQEGFTPGLWVAPFLASKTSNIFKQHPDWFLRSVKNPKKYVVGHFNPAWKRGSIGSMKMYILDLSNPDVLQHIEDTFRELAKHWDFFKVDFLAAGMREAIRLNGDKMTRVEAYIAGVKAIRRGIGPKAFLLGCGAPLMASMQSNCFDSMRVSCDTAERWFEPLLLRLFISDWCIPCCSKALWGNMTRWFMHDQFWRFNDPDCLVLRKKGNSMTEAQVRTQVTVLGMTGGLLLFTDNMATLEKERKELAFGVLPTTPLTGKPLGNLSRSMSAPSGFGLNDVDDLHSNAVHALINWTSSASSIVAPRDGFDFWHQKWVQKGQKVQLAAFDTCALQAPKEDALLVGTTLHIAALADGRIQAQQEKGVTIVSGTDDLVRRRGLLVFLAAADMLQVLSSDNIQVVRGPFLIKGGDVAAIEVEVQGPEWTLRVEKVSTPAL